MAVIALAGCSGAPGVTTSALALLLAWPLEPGRRMILAECDPDVGAGCTGCCWGSSVTGTGCGICRLPRARVSSARGFGGS